MIWYNPVDGSDAEYGATVMVKSISNVLNEDDEIVLQLDGWSGGSEIHVPVEIGKEDRAEGLEPGEIVQYAVNKEGEITEIQKLVNPIDPEQDYFLSSTIPYTRTRCLYGEISSIDRDNNVIVVKYQRDPVTGELLDTGIVNVLQGESGNNGAVLKYNVSRNSMEPGTWSDLRLGQKVVLDKNETAVRSVIILEER